MTEVLGRDGGHTHLGTTCFRRLGTLWVWREHEEGEESQEQTSLGAPALGGLRKRSQAAARVVGGKPGQGGSQKPQKGKFQLSSCYNFASWPHTPQIPRSTEHPPKLQRYLPAPRLRCPQWCDTQPTDQSRCAVPPSLHQHSGTEWLRGPSQVLAPSWLPVPLRTNEAGDGDLLLTVLPVPTTPGSAPPSPCGKLSQSGLCSGAARSPCSLLTQEGMLRANLIGRAQKTTWKETQRSVRGMQGARTQGKGPCVLSKSAQSWGCSAPQRRPPPGRRLHLPRRGNFF